MRGDKRQGQLALRVGIALAAGMFSIIPVACGAPSGGEVKAGGASIAYSDVVENNTVVGKDTNITSSTKNNVIDWHDFSVASKETVTFDSGNKTNNYVNIVSGANTSEINGAIRGGNEVYIINPNGVIFGKGSSVDVGSLYASTRDVSVSDAVAKANAANGTSSTEKVSDLITAASSTTGAAMDIVNMGKISADKVILEGENIRLLNSADITAASVTVRADDGYIHVGSSDGTGGTQSASTGIKYTSEKLTSSGSAQEVEGYKLVYNDSTTTDANGNTVATGNKWSQTLGLAVDTTDTTNGSILTGTNYMLAEDIDLLNGTAKGTNTVKRTFTGKVDGNFYAVKNAGGTTGLFAATNNATIENMGVIDSEFNSGSASAIIGGLVSTATDTKLYNVFNESTVRGSNYSGGIVGTANGLTMDSSYNTGNVYTVSGNVGGAGLVGYISGGTNNITNCYSTGSSNSGVLGTATAGTTTFTNVYINGSSKFRGNYSGTGTQVHIYDSIVTNGSGYHLANASGSETQGTGAIDLTAISTFTSGTNNPSWAVNTDISLTGGLAHDDNGNLLTDTDGKIYRPTWRIYEGQDSPMMTAFFKGIKNVTYDYGYYKSTTVNNVTTETLDKNATKYNNGTNGGQDMPAYSAVENNQPNGLVYNGETLKIVNNEKDENGNIISTTAATSTDGKLDDVSYAFTTKGTSTIENSHILYDASGQKDATAVVTYTTANNVTTSTVQQNTLALLHSDQQGYDLVGNNISISPRTVSATTDINSKTVVKEYDGTADASDAVGSGLFGGDSTTVTGILDVDKDTVGLTFTGSATFKTRAGSTVTESAAVGIYNDLNTYDSDGNVVSYGTAYVDIDGTITLNNGGNNYVLESGSNTISGQAKGVITQKALTVDLASTAALNKTYDKSAVAKGMVYANDQDTIGTAVNGGAVTDEDFSYDWSNDIVSITTGTGEQQSTTQEDVTLAFDSNAYYVDNNGVTTNKNVGTHKVSFGGLKLEGDDAANYKLVDGEGNVLYSAKPLILVSRDINGNVTATESDDDYTGGGALYTSGTIGKRDLSAYGFSWYNNDGAIQTATREYDGTTAYTAPEGFTVSNKDYTPADGETFVGMLDGDSLTFTVVASDTTNQGATFVTSKTFGTDNSVPSATKNVSEAQGVLYTVHISGDAAGNYTIGGQDIDTSAGSTNQVIGEGYITPRTLNVVLGDTRAVKTYDGDAVVKEVTDDGNGGTVTKTKFTLDDGYLKYYDATDNDSAHHLLSTENAYISIEGVYNKTGNDAAAKDVNYTVTANVDNTTNTTTYTYAVADKNITYTAKVIEVDENDNEIESGNYVFATTIAGTDPAVAGATYTDGVATFTKTNGGRINQAQITAVDFKDVSKTYDGDADVTNTTNTTTGPLYTNDRITIIGVTGLVGDDADDLTQVFDHIDEDGQLEVNYNNFTGQYGKYDDDGKFVADAHVARNATTHEVEGKVVEYKGLANLLKNHNYTLADDISDAIYDTGTINALEITDGDWIKLDRNSTAITKTYDGYANVTDAASYLTSRQAYVQPTGSTEEISITLTVEGAEFANNHSDNSAAKNVTYKLSVDETGDYSIAASLKTNGYVYKTIENGGVITPKAIVVSEDDIVSAALSKTYDASTTVAATGESLVSGINDQLVDIDQGTIYNNSAGDYNNKNVNENSFDSNGNLLDKVVTITLGLANNDTHNDYVFQKSVTDSNNDTTLVPVSTLTANGEITKRALTVTTTACPDKTYDTTTAVKSADMPTADTLDFGSTENNTVVGRDGFTVGKLSAAYDTPDVVRDSTTHQATDKTVNYSGVLKALGATGNADGSLTTLGTNAGNYEVANTFTGKGIIRPASIDESNFVFNLKSGITQVYSGSNEVGQYGMSNTEKEAFQRSWVDDSASGISLNDTNNTFLSNANADSPAYTFDIVSAAFDTADAATGKTVTYTISVDGTSLGNYDYTGPDTFTIDKSITSGSITARPVTVTATNDTLSKYYDGTGDIYNDNNKAWSGQTAGTYVTTALTGEDAVTMAAAVGTKNADGSWTETGLINGYGTNASTGQYTDSNVGDGNKTIVYTPTVSGVAATNYKFVDSNGVEISNTNPLQTTENSIKAFGVTITANPVTKTYDGTQDAIKYDSTTQTTTEVASPVSSATTILQLGDKPASGIAVALENGYVGIYDNPNVNGGADHVVTYSGLQLASDNYKFVTNTGVDMTPAAGGSTYTITGTGIITPLALNTTNVTLTFDTTTPTKEYDGTTAVKKNEELTDGTTNYITNFYVTLGNGDTQNIVYDYAAEYNDKDVADADTVTYKLGINGDNYTIDSALLTNGTVVSENGKYKWVASTAGTITPRTLNVVYDEGIRKIYDGTPDVEADDISKIHLANDDLEVLYKDGYISKDNNLYNTAGLYTVTAAYQSKNANVDPGAEVASEADHINVNYNVALNATSNLASDGNYTLPASSGTAKGDIERRKVAVAFADADASVVDSKPYDGTTAMASSYSNADRFKLTNLADSASTTGIVNDANIDETDKVTLNEAAITAVFANDGHVKRDANGNVIAQDVEFKDFTLTGTTQYPAGNYYVTTASLAGTGVITPKDVAVSVTNAPQKTYDGTKDVVGDTYLTNNITAGADINGDSLANSISLVGTPQYDDENAGTVGYTYNISLDNTDYNLVLDNGQSGQVAANGLTATLTGDDGTINKRKITPTLTGVLTKEYDGGTTDNGELKATADTNEIYDATNNTSYNLTNARITLNAATAGSDTGVLTGDKVGLTATVAYNGSEAGIAADSDDLQAHEVTYTLSVANNNYELDTTSLDGTGYIARKGLAIVATPATVTVGAEMPTFTGTVEGFVGTEAETVQDYADFVAEVEKNFAAPDGVTTANVGSYAVYSWYRDGQGTLLNTDGNQMEGKLGFNYYYKQSPANAKAFTVNAAPYDNSLNVDNPDTKITPNNDIYNQISKDMNSGFGDNGAAAIEYKDKSGKVLGMENIDSGEINGKGLTIGGIDMSNQADSNAHIGIAGGDIVNMEGANAAGSVNVETSGEGTVVNLEVFSIGGDSQTGDKESTVEISNTADKTYSLDFEKSTEGEIAIKNTNDITGAGGSIAITNEKQNILGEEVEDKKEDEEKEGEIAIKSNNGEDDDEIELTVEKEGVNVA